MLSKTILKSLNDQVLKEFYSSYLYLSMSAYCEAANLHGFAVWMKKQSTEEGEHGMKIYDYIHDRDGKITLQAIEQPPTDFGTPLEMFKDILDHEKKVTASITKLYEQSIKEKDYPTQIMLQWFIKEQVEEEKSTGDIIEQLKMIGDSQVSLMMLDRQLAMRGQK